MTGPPAQPPFAQPPFARQPVVAAMACYAVLVAALSDGYGFHRDELYFRMLHPALAYVDQPGLTPFLARVFRLIADEPWAVRIPAVIFGTVSIPVVVLITRELGGGRAAQALCAWGYASGTLTLQFGHVLLTASMDLLLWPLITLLVLRAVLRSEARWWLWAGVAVGVSTYNKLLVSLLIISLLAGVLVAGPRRLLLTRPVLLAAGIAVLIAAPLIVYQATHSWPQVTMGRALSQHNAGDTRSQMFPLLLVFLGPPQVPMWFAGVVALLRRPQWRAARFLAVAFPALLVLTFLGGSQVYYPYGLLAVVFAAGCVPTIDFLGRARRWWRPATVIALGVNAVVAVLVALPIIPVTALGSTPIPGINVGVADQVGWPAYARQVAGVWNSLPAADRARAVIVAGNYGEAGSIVRFGRAYGLPRPYSGQNQLYFDARPPDSATVLVVVGGAYYTAVEQFGSCSIRAHLDNGDGVDNEEQGEPVAICRDPRGSWRQMWPHFLHYD